MLARPWVRIVVRAMGLVVALLILYVGITYAQVWRASRDDDAVAADAIVVLGAAQYDGRPSPVLQRRLDHAHELYEQELAATIVVTGGRRAGDRFTEATAGYTYLREKGVPDSAILRETEGTNTWESLAAAAEFLRERGLERVVLVSDGYHAFRVEAIAEELGLDASVSPSRRGGSTRQLLKETAAVALGRIIGYRHLVDLDHAVSGRRDDDERR